MVDQTQKGRKRSHCIFSKGEFKPLLGVIQIPNTKLVNTQSNFTLHADDGVSLSGLDHTFTRRACGAAVAACNDESQQHLNLPRINNSISKYPQKNS